MAVVKRGHPLQRRTTLTSKTQLRTKTPLVSRCTLQRGGPINQVSAKRKVANQQRTRVVSAMRKAVEGECARCGRRDMPVRGHERLARVHGGDILNPDCLLCDLCNGWCEDKPKLAAWTGWKVSISNPHDPALTSSQARALDGSIVEFTVVTESEEVA